MFVHMQPNGQLDKEMEKGAFKHSRCTPGSLVLRRFLPSRGGGALRTARVSVRYLCSALNGPWQSGMLQCVLYSATYLPILGGPTKFFVLIRIYARRRRHNQESIKLHKLLGGNTKMPSGLKNRAGSSEKYERNRMSLDWRTFVIAVQCSFSSRVQ